MPPSRIAYHFTHIDNLANVIPDGGLLSDSMVTSSGRLVTETADTVLKQLRREKPVPLYPGGMLSDYVPFYFSPKSPMLLRVATGWDMDYCDGQDPLVFFMVEVDQLLADGYEVVVTDGHPIAALTDFAGAGQLETHVDWSIMRGNMWHNTDADGDRKRRRQAELLVHESVPLEAFKGLACRTRGTCNQVERLLAAAGVTVPVAVTPDLYYVNRP